MSDLFPPSLGAKSILLQRPGESGRLKLTAAVLEMWAPYVQDQAHKAEAGGVLLGRRILDSSDIIVDAVTLPSDEDRRTRFTFFRSIKHHQRRIDALWEESAGTVAYLGEWHTHPEGRPTPSCVDRRDWKRLVKRCRYDGDELFFVIVGLERVHAWEVSRSTREIRALERVHTVSTR